MKRSIIILSIISLIIGCSNNPKIPDNVKLSTWQDSVSYSLGSDVGATLKARKYDVKDNNNLVKGFMNTYSQDSSYVLGASIGISYNSQMIDIDPEIFLNALIGTYGGDSTQLSTEAMKAVVQKYDKELKETQSAKVNEKTDLQRINGERFIEEYKEKSTDAVSTESGLLYRVLTDGFGDTPLEIDRVVVHYTGKLINGTVFDSSVERGEPAKFNVNSVIKGWQEALQLMKVGSKWELVIPADLAYGNRATGNIPGKFSINI